MAKIINDFALIRNQWLGITKGLDQKQWQITNIVKLRVAGMEDATINRIILTDVDGVLLEWEHHFTKWMVTEKEWLVQKFTLVNIL